MFGGIGEGGVPVLTYFWNSLVISLTSTVIALLVGMAGGYAFAPLPHPGKGAIFVGLMVTRAGAGRGAVACRSSSFTGGLGSSTRTSA